MIGQFDIGIPALPDGELYGLWEPVTARFFFVIREKAHAQSLKLIASSRYSLFVTDIRVAKNYHHNIIDNNCCHNWTLSNRQDIMTVMLGNCNRVTAIDQLVPSVPESGWDLAYEMQYLQLCLWWLKYIDYCKNLNWYTFDRFINRLYDDMPWDHSSNLFSNIFDLETAILRALHRSRDNSLGHEDCETAVSKSHSVLRDVYASYRAGSRT